jgi:hypothetical protein
MMGVMDTVKLELAAQRYRDAHNELDAARADLQTEVVSVLINADERGAQAQVVRITGWTREQVRLLMKDARKRAATESEED